MISQSSTIAFFVLAGFIVYVTIKGELPSYAGVLGIGPKAGPSSATSLGSILSSPVQSAMGTISGIGNAIGSVPVIP
jgi:hypothetical protein